MAANIFMHPAPGLGYMMPGWFDVPQDPITRGMRGITYTPGIGDILVSNSARVFSVPQNPIKDFVTGNVQPLGQVAGGPSVGGNVSPAGGCGRGCSGGGMGDIPTDLSNMMT